MAENVEEQRVIRDIHDMRSSAQALVKIAGALTEHDVPTKTGKSNRWTHQAVQRILKRAV